MKSTLSMENLWQMISTLSLNNRRWLADKLIENIGQEHTEYISKEELLAGIDAGLKDVAAGRTQPFDEFVKEMEDAL